MMINNFSIVYKNLKYIFFIYKMDNLKDVKLYVEIDKEISDLIEMIVEEENIEMIASGQMVMNIVLSSAQKIIQSLDDNEFTLKEKTEFVTFLLPKILDVLVKKELIEPEKVDEYKLYIGSFIPQMIFIIDLLVDKIDMIDGVDNDMVKINENCHIPCSIL